MIKSTPTLERESYLNSNQVETFTINHMKSFPKPFILQVWLHRERKADDRSAEELFEEDRDLGGWVIRLYVNISL